MNSRQRAYLKGLGAKTDPVVHIGKASLTEEIIGGVREALEARELIKVSVLKNCLEDPVEVGKALALAVDAQLVQVIGKKIILYKEAYDPKNRKLSLPK